MLVGSFFVKLFILGFFGVAVIFVACTMNLAINTSLGLDISFKRGTFNVPWMLLWQALLSLAITLVSLFLVYYYYRHGEMPSYLQPLPAPVKPK